MSNVSELHTRAMDLAMDAMVARHKGESEQATILTREALRLEAEAADQINRDPSTEPTRSILYRSAAALAYQCGEWEECERLCIRGLIGYPFADTEDELRELRQLAVDKQIKALADDPPPP